MRPMVCATCEVELEPKQNSFPVKISDHSAVMGDLYECPGCHAEIITGFGAPFPRVKLHEPVTVDLDLGRRGLGRGR